MVHLDQEAAFDIRPFTATDGDAVWSMMEPVLRAGETYALPRDWSRKVALDYWCGPGQSVAVAVERGRVVGTSTMRPNYGGGGAHVANCGYITSDAARGRGVAGFMCRHSLIAAKERGFTAMQFNFVVSSNERAVRLWNKMGFAIVGTLPGAFAHPRLGNVDVYVMHRTL